MKQKISINAIDKTFNSLYDIRGKYPCTQLYMLKFVSTWCLDVS